MHFKISKNAQKFFSDMEPKIKTSLSISLMCFIVAQ